MTDPREPVRNSLLPFARPHFDESAIEMVVETLRDGWVVAGPRTQELEAGLESFLRSNHVVAVSSCTAAMHMSLLAAGIGVGDEVITTPLTFVATVNAILHCGATPVLADVDRATQTINPHSIAKAVGPKTRAIMPMHMAGRPCDMDSIGQIADRNDLLVIEDAAHALGASYRGVKVGALSDSACFSLHATKHFTTIEGGLVATPHETWASTIRTSSNHGLADSAWEREDDHDGVTAVAPGYKCVLNDVQAALGLAALPHIDDDRRRREAIWRSYDEALADLPVGLPAPQEPDTVHARHLYTIMLDLDRLPLGRRGIRDALAREGISTAVHFRPVHLQPYFTQQLHYSGGDFPNAEWIGNRTLSLPMTSHLTDEDAGHVLTAVRKVLLASLA